MESQVDLNDESSKATTIASKTSFKAFSLLLEKVNKIDESNASLAARGGIGKNEEKKRTLEEFIDKWRSLGLKNSSLDNNFFPVMRLLLPADDRRVYGLKEFRLAKYLIEALCIAPKSGDALKLLNYRAPSNVKSDGDFASVAYFVLKNRCRDDLTLTIEEVNFHLDNISANNAKGKEGQKEVNSSIQKLLVNLSAIQLKWLIRIILKDLKIGIKEHTILEAYHPDAMDLYNFSSSLEKVCDTLNDPHKRLHEVGVCIFSPCRPMLGEKAKPTKIESLLGGNSFYIETKFDGERFQLHKSKDKYVYFSRNGHDYTDVFGSDIYSGSLTPFIHSSFSNDVQTVILDGEMCGYNTRENVLLSVSEAYDVKSNARYYEDIQTCFCVFDVLLYNDEVLTNKPLKERIEYLKKSFKEIDGRIIFSQQEIAHSNQHVVDALNRAIDSRLEGIVVKNPDSVYKPSVRSGSGWYKVKPDYMLGLNDDLDLLIVGAYYGVGRRSGLLSHFLLAVALDEEKTNKNNKKVVKAIEMDDDLDFEGKNDESKEDVCLPKTFYSFCKIGSGYTLKELYDFNQKLSDKWVTFDKKNPPAHLQLTYEKPDVWIDPKHSLIVQVKAVEICTSDKYKANCTLRFPRLEKFRPDKQWHECMKFSELKELRDKNEGKLTSGKHFDLDDYDEDGNFKMGEEGDEPLIKRKKKSTRMAKMPTVNARFRGIDSSAVNKIADLFDDKEFCIIMGNEKYDKLALERKVAELGGQLVQNPGPDTFCIITSKLIHKVNPYITKNLYDVVKVEWLIKCIENRKLMPFKKSDLFHCSKKETKEYLSTNYDLYGDSYTEDLTIETLKELFQTMSDADFVAPLEQNRNQLREQIATIENKYFPDESYKFGLFRLCNIYLDCHQLIESKSGTIVEGKRKTSSLDLIGLKVRWRGGNLIDLIDENTTHCVLDKMDLSNLNELKKLNSKRTSKFHIVSTEWITKCIESNRLINELPFHM